MSAPALPLPTKRPLVLCERQGVKQPRPPPPHTAFFADPERARALAASVLVTTTEQFDDDQIPRVWISEDSKRRTLSYLSVHAPQVEANLRDGGFGELYGIKQEKPLDLSKYSLTRLDCGTFNQLWKGTMTQATRCWFPPEIATLLAQGRLVIRAPLEKTHSSTRQEIIGEMDNVLHAALHGYGPLVAGMTWVRTVHREGQDEGMLRVKYRLVTFMEKGSMSVYGRIKLVRDQGFVPNGHPFSTPHNTERYFDSLLRCVHAYSIDRFVYLDATLRNFVDFVGTPSQSLVKVIDIDDGVFRRFGESAKSKSRAWQLLWLHNILVVSCFLKRYLSEIGGFTLGARKEIRTGQQVFDTYWWNKIQRAVTVSRRLLTSSETDECDAELQSCRTFLSSTQRSKEMTIHGLWVFPETTHPPYAGTSPCALAKSAMAYCYYYFVRQPIEEVEEVYCKSAIKAMHVRTLSNVSPEERRRVDDEHGKATRWFNAVARRTIIPTALFFYRKFKERGSVEGGSACLVDIMAEFANTPQEAIERRYASRLVPPEKHTLVDLINMKTILFAMA